MSSNDPFLSALLEKKAVLQKQLEAITTTIDIFQSNGSTRENANGHAVKPEEIKTNEPNSDGGKSLFIPSTYSEATTWKDKILFALSKLEYGFVKDIVAELIKADPDQDEKDLIKKVTGYASSFKTQKILGAKAVGNKYKYFIKK